ncbi:MAG TPA: Na+/H+ antiporter NhaA, partial [Polyangiaceae bacterium LLY-WYZ-15_(1-7)]|nr:Na+/H+ antiporter NhaA [Polyangiaceae bacterium LLY-WYZ-15_(1-7)]
MSSDPLSTSLTSMIRSKQRPIDRLLSPLQTFARHKLAGAGLLMLASLAALIVANTSFGDEYHHFLETPIGIGAGDLRVTKTLHHWVNDGLMAVFFFVVGLEIKRELLVGELSTIRKATLPALAALGGMIVPAIIYYLLNPPETQQGWGVPMATDIAFALGVLALLGDRIPIGLRVFLTALAIVDDIGAVVVIALFYTADVSITALVIGLSCWVVSITMNRLQVRQPIAYLVVGLSAWLGFLESGVHATIASILMAFTIPARTRIDGEDFLLRLTILKQRLEKVGVPCDTQVNSPEQQHIFEKMNQIIDDASSPLQRIEHALTPLVTFVVLPVFALSNAGVHIGGGFLEALQQPMAYGIIAGLFLGKSLGIFGASWLAVKLGLADLPQKVNWAQLFGVGILGGIGFTMALFIAGLAFPEAEQLETAKVGIMIATIVSGLVGFLVVRATSGPAEASKEEGEGAPDPSGGETPGEPAE